jgi:hypothetical protein
MPIDFPDSPQVDDVFTAPSGRVWRWTGVRWESGAAENVETLIAENLSAIIDSAPTALDTLNELAAALGDDADFAATVTNQLGTLESEIDTKTSTGKAIAMAIVFG